MSRKEVGLFSPVSLKRYFISGVAVITPVVLTIYVIGLLFKLIDLAIGRFINSILKLAIGFEIPGLHIVLSILLIFFVGLLVQNFLARRIVLWFESLINRMPLIGRIYSSVKRVAEYFFPTEERMKFGKVVLVEYPRKGMYSIAFLSSESVKVPNEDKELVAVFIPTSPSPLTGFLEFVPKADVLYLDISVESALQTIVSGGVALPEGWQGGR